MGCDHHRSCSQSPPTTYLVLSLALPRHPRRDATLLGTRAQSAHCLGAQALLIVLTNISHSGDDEVSDKASRQPRLAEAPVFSSPSMVSGNSGLVWGVIPRHVYVALQASEEHRWLTCMLVCR